MANITMTPEIKEMRKRAKSFLDERIIPNEHLLDQHDDGAAYAPARPVQRCLLLHRVEVRMGAQGKEQAGAVGD